MCSGDTFAFMKLHFMRASTVDLEHLRDSGAILVLAALTSEDRADLPLQR
jgi:hypothetical protein